ncbi:prepilin peptidase [uncultured Novosphingobium sp.]|uniref:prepilin peptidase n=1 Tax=uncultured Novosphingobium sp. TaxID=292277 RepID=UPI003749AA4C
MINVDDLSAAGAVYPGLTLAAALAMLLLCGAIVYSDFAHRRIPNGYCAAIAVLSVLWWVGLGGVSGLVGLAYQLAVPLLAAIPLLALFAARVLAGGDVKLLLSLLLWTPAALVLPMLIVIILGGGALGLVLKLLKRLFCAVNADTVPYGVPIIAGALLVLIPEFRMAMSALQASWA